MGQTVLSMTGMKKKEIKKHFSNSKNYFLLLIKAKKLLSLFLKTKLILEIPKKKNYLIYDNVTKLKKSFFFFLFKSKNYCIFYTRFEKINLFVLLYTFIKDGLNNITENYKKNYINFIKPKIVYCALDQYVNFFFLKKIYPQAIYISDQHGIIKENGRNWPNNSFYKQCVDYKKKMVSNPKLILGLYLMIMRSFGCQKLLREIFIL